MASFLYVQGYPSRMMNKPSRMTLPPLKNWTLEPSHKINKGETVNYPSIAGEKLTDKTLRRVNQSNTIKSPRQRPDKNLFFCAATKKSQNSLWKQVRTQNFPITSKVGTSWKTGTSYLLFCGLELEEEGVPEVCKILASLFCLLLQKFFTSLSVLPGKYVAILAHLFPNSACKSITTLSSSAENLHPL